MHNLQAETRFVELMADLFQLDEAEALDFGIYRMIRLHNREVREFLGEIVSKGGEKQLQEGTLSALLESAFTATDYELIEQAKERKAELESQLGLDARQSLDKRKMILADHSKLPALKALVEEYHNTIATLEAQYTGGTDRTEVLNHLYNFFARHYQDGDFIVERRFSKNGSRYIQSRGEDTEFHWATEDMYYIKSGDTFTDYTVTLSSGEKLIFSVEPDTLNDTRASLKPADKAHYEIDAIEKQADGSYKVVLSYLRGAQSGKQKGKIAKAVCEYLKADETEVKSWLNHFIARNQSDFFIHKKLAESLTNDLDIFIKTEVLNTDQLLELNDLPRRTIQMGRIVKQVGLQIIDFLATLEDFQKRLWEKKKLVFNTRYVITLDRIAKLAGERWLEQQLPTIFTAQKDEWETLGLGDFETTDDCREVISSDLDNDIKFRWLPLPVDTGLLDNDFKWALLAAVTQTAPLDDNLDGVAVRSDNWQALNTLKEKYREQVKCIYIDPPYNTKSTPIVYKNGYKSASWTTLIENRFVEGLKYLSKDGTMTIAIDDAELQSLTHIINNNASSYRLTKVTVVHNPKGSITKDFNRVHEYSLFLVPKHLDNVIARKLEENSEPRKIRRWGENSKRTDRKLSFYPIYVKNGKIVRIGEVSDDNFHPPSKNILQGDGTIAIYPIDQNGVERRWNFGLDSINENIDRIAVLEKDGEMDLFLTHEKKVPKTVWHGGQFDSGKYGNNLLINMLGKKIFDFPKSINLVKRCIYLSTNNKKDALIFDFFGGSGTTAHATMLLNQKDGGSRQFLTVETNEYFHSVIVPRIKKAAVSSIWQDGNSLSPDGPGIFMRIQELEQYEDTLENLDTELSHQNTFEFEDPAFSLRYRINRESRAIYCAIDSYKSPWGYQLKRALGGGEAPSQPVDLVESLIYLLGLHVSQLYREDEGVVITGQDRRGRSVAVFFRDCEHTNSEVWVEDKLNSHDAQMLYTNLPAELGCQGSERFSAIESVFSNQFVGGER